MDFLYKLDLILLFIRCHILKLPVVPASIGANLTLSFAFWSN